MAGGQKTIAQGQSLGSKKFETPYGLAQMKYVGMTTPSTRTLAEKTSATVPGKVLVVTKQAVLIPFAQNDVSSLDKSTRIVHVDVPKRLCIHRSPRILK